MTTRYLVDPVLVAILDQFPSLELTDETLGQIRAMTQAMSSQMLPNFPHVQTLEAVEGVTGVRQEWDATLIEIGSGTYTFTSRLLTPGR